VNALRAAIDAVALIGPGLNGWEEARAVLAGERDYVAAPTATYPPGPARTSFFESYLERVRAIPGVTAAGLVNFLPPVEGRVVLAFHIEGQPPPNSPRT